MPRIAPVLWIVDDDEGDRFLFRRALLAVEPECRLLEVPDGELVLRYLAGRDALHNRPEHPVPDLVLLDLKMPKVSGLDVLRWIRSSGPWRTLRVVVLTSSPLAADIHSAYELGANAYVVKPVSYDELTEAFRALCKFWLRCAAAPHPSDLCANRGSLAAQIEATVSS